MSRRRLIALVLLVLLVAASVSYTSGSTLDIVDSEGRPQPEVAVQLTPRLTAELAYRIEAPMPGRAPDRTYLTLDLRLFRNWSLSTTIGDAGSFVIDLLWRYRY